MVGSIRSKGRDRPARTRARRRGGHGPLTPAPSHASAPLPPARTLASPGDMQMRYPRGGGPGRGVGRGRRGGSGLRAPGAHPATPAPELTEARAPTSRPAKSARARARRPLSWRPSQSTARRSSLAAAPAGPAPCARGGRRASARGRVEGEGRGYHTRDLGRSPGPTAVANPTILERWLPPSVPQSVCLFQGVTVAAPSPVITTCAFLPLPFCDTPAPSPQL